VNIENNITNAILNVLSERIDPKILKKANIASIRKNLWKIINQEIFHSLLKNKKLNLYAGFGTLFIKNIKEKDKKVFNRKKNEMEYKKVKGFKIVFRPGETLREFL